jgi:signal transduction histidine kinase
LNEQAIEKILKKLIATNKRLKGKNKAALERIATLEVLQSLTQSLSSELNLEPLLKNILRAAVEVVGASAGSLLLLDPITDELVFEVIEGGAGEALEKRRMKKDKGIAGWVVTHCQPMIVQDVSQDDRLYKEVLKDIDFQTTSLICIPLMTKGQIIGVLQILNKRSGELFDNEDVDLLTTFAAQSAVAIENARLYRDLREERDRIVALEEDVRKRLARDLHDGPAQLLSAIIMSLSFVKKLVAREPQKVEEEVTQLESMASRALRQVRTMLFDLRPVILETHGLVPALETYAERLRENEGMTIQLRLEGTLERLEPQAESAIFSIVQEAVNNAKKYAREGQVWLTVQRREDELVVSIKDEGPGFDVTSVEKSYGQRGSLGLINMRERAALIEGNLSIQSAVGQGTTVVLTVPLDRHHHH